MIRLGSFVFASTALLTAPALAADDGSYGRLEGDTSASVEVGASLASAPRARRGAGLTVRGRFTFLHSIGVVGQYDEGFEVAPFGRAAAGAIELRPLFLGRWARAMQQGPPRLDLFLDSTALTMGMYGAWPTGECPRCPDVGMEAGLGFEVPFLPRASTPYVGLRAAMRWSLLDRAATDPGAPVMGLFTLTFGYRRVFTTHLVDVTDQLDRR